MKHQALFSTKDKRKKNKMSSAAIFVWRFKGSMVGGTIVLYRLKNSSLSM